MTEYRAVFDAEITFLNGGGLQVQDFRLDVAGPQPAVDEVAGLLVRHLGLLMVDAVRVENLRVVAQPHRGSRGGPSERAPVESGGSTVEPSCSGAGASGSGAGAGGSGVVAGGCGVGAGAGRLVELSHPIVAGMTTYPGLPGPEITPHMSREQSRGRYAPGIEFTIDRISMVGNTGTYLDSPFHRFADGADLADFPLGSVADLPVVVVRLDGKGAGAQVTGTRGIGPDALRAVDVAGRAVLLHTGWDRHWGTPAYGDPAPFLTGAAATCLAEAGAALVGIDSVNMDDAVGGERPAHTILLAAGIPVLEHLTGLAEVPVTGARLHAAPPRIRGLGTFPVRAYAIVPG